MMASIERCPWPGIADPIYARYHDSEWGLPLTEDRRLFEKLILEGFQAGLSWLTILKKREAFRDAFDDFDAERIARYDARDIARLMRNDRIIRNRAKIEGAVLNARAYLTLRESTTLASFLWSHLEDGPIINSHVQLSDVPASNALSLRISRALKKCGFHFVGPVTTYAHMQAIGMVNDHLVSCPRHRVCADAQRRVRLPLMERRP
jgi:DNA-3-methyladenine glycosylase I